MKNYIEEAIKYTDEEYLSKKEIEKIVGSSKIDAIWNETVKYRESYKKACKLTRSDGIPFSYTINDSINEYIDVVNDNLDTLKDIFNNLEKLNDLKFNEIKKDIISNEVYYGGKHYKLNVTVKDIRLVLDSSIGINNDITSLLKAYKYVLNYESSISKEFIFNIEKLLNNNMDVNYRSNTIGISNPYKCEEYIDYVVDVCKEKTNPILVASLIHFVFLYSIPFDKYSSYVGTLLTFKYLKDNGYNNVLFYSLFIKNLYQRSDDFKKAISNTLDSLDFTYYLITYLQTLIIGLDEALDKFKLIKGTYNQNKVEEEIKLNIENIDDIEEKEEKRVSYLDKDYQKPVNNRPEFDFIDDPFTSSSSKSKIRLKKETTITKIDLYKQIKKYLSKNNYDIATKLLELEPKLTKTQCYFYASNHDSNSNYTINDYKRFSNLTYEESIKEFNELVSYNLYNITYIDNKLVYKVNNA